MKTFSPEINPKSPEKESDEWEIEDLGTLRVQTVHILNTGLDKRKKSF